MSIFSFWKTFRIEYKIFIFIKSSSLYQAHTNTFKMHISKSLLAFVLYAASIYPTLAAPVTPDKEFSPMTTLQSVPIPGRPIRTLSRPLWPWTRTTGRHSSLTVTPFYVWKSPFCESPFGLDFLTCNNVYRFQPTRQNREHWEPKGRRAKKSPFKDGRKFDTKTSGKQYESPEEFPFASTNQGGNR